MNMWAAARKTKPFSVFLISLQTSVPPLCADSQAVGTGRPQQPYREGRVTLRSRWASKHRRRAGEELVLAPCPGAQFLRCMGLSHSHSPMQNHLCNPHNCFDQKGFSENNGFDSLSQLPTMLQPHFKLRCQVQWLFFLLVWDHLPKQPWMPSCGRGGKISYQRYQMCGLKEAVSPD